MVPPSLTHQPKVIVCDVDKTLTAANTWFSLTTALGGDIEKHFQIYNAYFNEKISTEDMKKGLFEMWEKGHHSKIHRDELEDILFKIPLRGEAFSTFAELRDKGYTLCLISSSIDIFVKMVAQRLQLDHWYANSEFIFDDKGYWIDFKYDRDEAGLKLRQIREFLRKQGVSDDECLILGDGSSEIKLFENYPGIAVDSENETIKKLAWQEIKYLPTVLQLLQEIS
ncbi:MAG: HAD-IB family phosphatase [Patescibacteria group bacterium]